MCAYHTPVSKMPNRATLPASENRSFHVFGKGKTSIAISTTTSGATRIMYGTTGLELHEPPRILGFQKNASGRYMKNTLMVTAEVYANVMAMAVHEAMWKVLKSKIRL
jgi:hypothetical protein